MRYNPDKGYYRCTIIRGKAQQEMDDMLPFYATSIKQLCPMGTADFRKAFRDIISRKFFGVPFEKVSKSRRKTIDNHRTEIAGKHLGLYRENNAGVIVPSESCQMVIANLDQPAFFKNLCLNFQFPNFTQKIQTVSQRVVDGISFRPYHFILALLIEAEKNNVILSIQHFAYYVLSSVDVLRGGVSPSAVMTRILKDHSMGLRKKVPSGPKYMQHIREQFNMLELANLINIKGSSVYINHGEDAIISRFVAELDKPLGFNMSRFDLSSQKGAAAAEFAWEEYYGSLHCTYAELNTTVAALAGEVLGKANQGVAKVAKAKKLHLEETTQEIGEDGESFAFAYEHERIAQYYPQLAKTKVFRVGDRKGLGYDINSIEGHDNPKNPEKQRFIEVKSTKRTTEPKFGAAFDDRGVNVTYTEWQALQDFGSAYMFYLVFITKQGKYLYRITEPREKEKSGALRFRAPVYEMTYNQDAVEKIYEEKIGA